MWVLVGNPEDRFSNNEAQTVYFKVRFTVPSLKMMFVSNNYFIQNTRLLHSRKIFKDSGIQIRMVSFLLYIFNSYKPSVLFMGRRQTE